MERSIGSSAVASGGSNATGGASAPSGVASAAAIAYPYFGGTPGVAPDHTIVVTGYGQASMPANGADRAKAQATALETAMTDARAQADAIAKLAGVTITGVLSVGASGGGYNYAVPMPMSAGPGIAPSAGSGGTGLPAPVPSVVTPITFGMSVTVAYSISG